MTDSNKENILMLSIIKEINFVLFTQKFEIWNAKNLFSKYTHTRQYRPS